MGMTRKGSFFKGGVDCTGVETMNKPWVFGQLEDLMFLLCGLGKPQAEDVPDADVADTDDSPGGDSGYEPNEKELELLHKLTAIVLGGPNVNKGALKEFEKKYPWVSCIICACHCPSGFFKHVFKLPSIATIFKLASDTGNKFRRCKWLREQARHHVEFNPETRAMDQFKTGTSMYIRHVATRFASKLSVLERAILMNPVAKLVMSSPTYKEKYEEEDVAAIVANNEDSDDEYVAKDKRSKL